MWGGIEAPSFVKRTAAKLSAEIYSIWAMICCEKGVARI
jgi:hypothetical protein